MTQPHYKSKHRISRQTAHRALLGRQRSREGNRRDVALRTLHPDLLTGADQIAVFLFGDASLARRVYHMVQEEQIPTFRLGGRIYARRSVLSAYIEKQERRVAEAESFPH